MPKKKGQSTVASALRHRNRIEAAELLASAVKVAEALQLQNAMCVAFADITEHEARTKRESEYEAALALNHRKQDEALKLLTTEAKEAEETILRTASLAIVLRLRNASLAFQLSSSAAEAALTKKEGQ